jgi:hypothetical protein
MLDAKDLEKIGRKFAEKINALTGIQIHKDEITLHPKKKKLVIKAWGCDIAHVLYEKLDTQNLEAYVMNNIIRTASELRAKIIKCKIYHLSKSIPEWETEIKQSLEQQNVSSTFVEGLRFNIVDHGYRYKHYSAKDEALYDYPFLALQIQHEKEGFHFSFPINVYDAMDPLDIEFLKNDLFVAILERTLESDKDLKNL